MIKLHRLNGSTFYLNCDHIETLESTPDTVIHLVNDKTYIVKEPVDLVIEEVIAFRQKTSALPVKKIDAT